MGETLFTAPRVRFLESVACSRYYAHHDPSRLDSGGSVPELLCKIDAVQTEVASVMGWQLFFDSIPAILLPIPYGYLADTRGRKWILIMGLTGYTLSLASILYLIGVLGLPLRFTWFSSLFFLIGGGPTVATTMLTTMVADVVPTNLRSTVFFYRFCSDQLADLVVPPIAPMLMAKGTMHPLIVAVGLQLLALALALPLPETLSSTDPKTSDGICTASPVPGVPQSSDTCRPRQDLASWLPRIKESFAFVLRDTTVACLVYTFFISKLGRQANGVLFQYASKRYGWSIAQAGLLVSLRAGVNIILFTVILPAVTNFLLVSKPATTRDFLVGAGSIFFLTLGYFVLFLSSTAAVMIIGVAITTLGAGFAPVMRSLVTSLVESQQDNHASDIGRLYALISVVEGVGSLVAGPGMSWAFAVGINLGRAWLGVPFAVACSLFALVSVLVYSLKL
ncbi:hypothetical protein BB8028_0002g04610 [Beauveria bassiana]|uniref:Major facilitator superfamily (MFS) profile domain-containing protein n=1 Tax=Beauveria bassiana TaxID=176275 RepID=A0A2S7Y1U5_BEABA|nr:hypothetical protein BB8028_0002g04610 [Beauveria bassiana]